MATLKYSGNISGVNPGDYGVKVQLLDVNGNPLGESQPTPINVKPSSGSVNVGNPDLSVVD